MAGTQLVIVLTKPDIVVETVTCSTNELDRISHIRERQNTKAPVFDMPPILSAAHDASVWSITGRSRCGAR
jgi:hypothetical protein